MAWLSFSADGKEQVVELTDSTFLIGRKSSCHIRFRTDNKVSGVHCSVVKRPDGYRVVDQNSKNGTYHNGKKLRGTEAPLKDGDTIGISKQTELVFLLHDPNPPEPEGSGIMQRVKSWFGTG